MSWKGEKPASLTEAQWTLVLTALEQSAAQWGESYRALRLLLDALAATEEVNIDETEA